LPLASFPSLVNIFWQGTIQGTNESFSTWVGSILTRKY
jgi:hypothetical protein